MAEFRSHGLKTLGLAATTGVFTAIFAASAAVASDSWLFSGSLLAAALLLGFATAVLIWRVFAGGPLVRIDDTGVYFRRLRTTIPWEALDRVERFTARGEHMLDFVECRGGHPVFHRGRVALGAAANSMAGLPKLCDNFAGVRGGLDAVVAAIEQVNRVPVTRRD
ncbi:MAG: hypothetical protein AAFX03_02275 [Pseudomonadota bacterium]